MNISEYLDEVISKWESGQATEHSYRPALEKLFQSISPDLLYANGVDFEFIMEVYST